MKRTKEQIYQCLEHWGNKIIELLDSIDETDNITFTVKKRTHNNITTFSTKNKVGKIK